MKKAIALFLALSLLFPAVAYCRDDGFFNILQEPNDVDKTKPTDGQVLQWSSSRNLWVPTTPTGGAPGGSGSQVQYRVNSTTFGGITGATSDGTNLSVTTQAALDNSNKAASTAYADSAVVTGIPIGTVIPYAGFTAPNSSWVLANGQEVSRSTYAAFKTAMTFTKTVNTTNASATISSVADTSNIYFGIPVEGTGVPAPVTTTANITAGSSIMAVTSATGLSQGMWIRDTAGNLPTGTFIKTLSGTNVTLGRWQPTVESSSALQKPAMVANSIFSQKTVNGNTYTFLPAIYNTITTNTSFVMSNNAGSSNTGITMTFFPYGNGDGSTTINVPDMRSKMVLGAGQSNMSLGGGNQTPLSGQYSTSVIAGLSNDFMYDNSGDAFGAFNVSAIAGEDNGFQLGNILKLPAYVAMNYIVKVQ